MRVHVSVCYLLVCTSFGLLVGADPIRTRNPNSVAQNVIKDTDDDAEEQALQMIRLSKEYRAFKHGLMVEDDRGRITELTLDEAAGATETERETKRDLHNRVFFRLYTRKNPYDYQPLWVNDKESLAASNFNAEKPTHFITHGWINSGNSAACTLIRDAYLKHDDYNVIVVDWSKITLRPYTWAARRVVMVGKYVAEMIDFLEEHARLDTLKTTLAGHSLGAHVMGLGGYYANSTIHYIVGLDPALPLFLFAGVGSRISTADANHVQIIHTNAGLLGFLTEIGHSDFYPNGGSRQSGCFVDPGGACSHARSYRFFAESINTQTGFYGKQCGSFLSYMIGRCKNKKNSVMGGSLIDFANGKYFLSTKAIEPFAKGR